MSLPASAVSGQSRHIKHVLLTFPGTAIPLETNKRIVACCLNPITARSIAKALRSDGYHTEVAKGLKTSRLYINVSFNYPY